MIRVGHCNVFRARPNTGELVNRVITSDLFGPEPIRRVWLEPICIGGGSDNLGSGGELILRLWDSWSIMGF